RRRLGRAEIDDSAVSTAAHNLSKHGFVRMLKTNAGAERVLLAPELLNNLAASFVLEARRDPRGLGVLDEARVLRGDYGFPDLRSGPARGAIDPPRRHHQPFPREQHLLPPDPGRSVPPRLPRADQPQVPARRRPDDR